MVPARRFTPFIALGAGLGLVLSACGGGKDSDPAQQADFSATPSGTVRTLGFNPDDEVGSSRADLAEKQLSDVQIEMDTSDFDPQKFAALSASGNVPDIVQMDRDALATYAAKGLVLPMDACFSAHGVKPAEHWYPAVTDEVTYEGAVYGAPQFFQPSVMIMNKRIMDKAGVTPEMLDTSKPEQFLAAVKKLTVANGGKPVQLGFDPDVPGSVGMWFTVFGGSTVDENGAPSLDTPENAKAMAFLKQLMDLQGGYAEVTSFKQTWDVFGDRNQFVTDASAGGLWGQWYLNVLGGSAEKVDIVSIPLRDPAGKLFAMAGGTVLAIPAKAKNPTAACAWAVQVTSQEAWEAAGDARAKTNAQEGSFNTGIFSGSPAADRAVRDKHVKPTGDAGFDQSIETTYTALENTVSQGATPVGSTLKDALATATGAVMDGSKTPEQALKDAQATVRSEYDKTQA